jgi:hypothetical protein
MAPRQFPMCVIPWILATALIAAAPPARAAEPPLATPAVCYL